SGMVLDLIREVRARGTPVVLISHNMPQVFEIADRLHVMRLGRRVATITPKSHTMTEAVAPMAGATSFHGTGGEAEVDMMQDGQRYPRMPYRRTGRSGLMLPA